MSHAWYSSYPQGIPHEVDVFAYDSLVDVFETACDEYANKPCFCNFGKTISYQQLDEYSRNFAAFLQNQLNMQQGDKFAIMMPNLLQNPIAIFGALRAGLTVVNVNPLYTADELRHQLCDSEATGIIVLENFASTLQTIISATPIKHVITSRMGDMLGFPKSGIINLVVKHIKKMVPSFDLKGGHTFSSTLKLGKTLQYTRPVIKQTDFAFLQYTGGTTGVAKGAILTHGNMVACPVLKYVDGFSIKPAVVHSWLFCALHLVFSYLNSNAA